MSAGSLKQPNLEILLASGAQTSMFSADLEGQVAIREQLENVGIKTVYLSVETFEDYLNVLKYIISFRLRREGISDTKG